MKNYAVYFTPRGSLHAEEIGSDTLFGAVCWAIAILGLDDVSKILEGFQQRPLFAFSSAFPFLSYDDGLLHFYPKPFLPELSPEQLERLVSQRLKEDSALQQKQTKLKVIEKAKLIKECQWVSADLFAQIVQGKSNQENLCQRLTRRGIPPADIEKWGSFLITSKEREEIKDEELLPPWRLKDIVRNQIERRLGTTAEGFLFMESELFFAPGAGLWCLICVEEECLEKLLHPALRYLADTGIGGERSVGKGHFDIQIKESPPLPNAGEAANTFLSLSYYLPAEGEIRFNSRYMSYRLVHRWAKRESKFPEAFAGQRSPPIYKQPVRLFAPGSLLPFSKRKEIYGYLAPVAKDQPWTVWQSGLAIGTFAFISYPEGENDAE